MRQPTTSRPTGGRWYASEDAIDLLFTLRRELVRDWECAQEDRAWWRVVLLDEALDWHHRMVERLLD